MEDRIHISYEQVRERAEQFRSQASNLSELITSIDGYMEQLMSDWEGDSSQAFMGKFTEIRPGFVSAEEMLREIGAALDQTADRFQSTNERLGKQFQ